MKYIYIIIFSSLFLPTNSFAQWLWSKHIGGNQAEYNSTSCSDSNGNIYIAGDYTSNPINFYTTMNSCVGFNDIYIAKYYISFYL